MKTNDTTKIEGVMSVVQGKSDSKVTNKIREKRKLFLTKKSLGVIALLLLTPVLLIAYALIITVRPLVSIKSTLERSQIKASQVYDSFKQQDLVLVSQGLQELRSDYESIATDFERLSWYRYTPFNNYYQDGLEVLVAADNGLSAAELMVENLIPYADVLGFSGKGSFTGGSAEERIVKIVETVGQVAPSLDLVIQKLDQVEASLALVNPDRYPFTYQGRDVAALIGQAQSVSKVAASTVLELKPLLEVLPSVAGVAEPRRYLVIFQNDAEIRPTGGFMTAYGVITVDKGKVNQEKSDDIYVLDQKFNSKLAPPDPIKKHLKMIYWNLRDMNYSPDFKESMELFLTYYRQVPGESQEIDGVIAIDTNVLADLVDVLGGVEVPGFGRFTADIDERCNCPEVIYRLEDIATRPVAYVRDDRKAFLGPMMQTMLTQAYGAPSEVWPRLFRVFYESTQRKHVLFYLFDEKEQQAAEMANFAGRIVDFEGDYLHINDANLGGAKSNLFITEEVELNITPETDVVNHQASITYRNPQPWDDCNLESGGLCLSGEYRGILRVYLPLGTQLVEALGFEEGSVNSYEDLDKFVVEGFYKFQPLSQARIRLTYNTPRTQDDQYRLLIQKQPGKKSPTYKITFNNTDQLEFELPTDKVVEFDY